MSSAVEAHVLDRLAAAPVAREPFPHCVVDEIFSREFFESIIDSWPEKEESWQPLSESGRVTAGAYSARRVVLMNPDGYARLDDQRSRFWREVGGWLLGPRFRSRVMEKFDREPASAASDALIVSDRTTYAIGPHTDAPHRALSLLFYLPEDSTFRRFGTSLYEPLDPAFRCPGGPQAFPKSDRCFHGVEPVDLPGIDRRLLIYNVRVASATAATTSSQAP